MEAEEEEQSQRSSFPPSANKVFLARARPVPGDSRPKRAAALRQELADSLAILRGTLDATADGILVTDEHGSVLCCNRQFVDLWRMPPEVFDGAEDRALVQAASSQLK